MPPLNSTPRSGTRKLSYTLLIRTMQECMIIKIDNGCTGTETQLPMSNHLCIVEVFENTASYMIASNY